MMLSGLKRIRIIHRLRVTMALLGFIALVAAIGGLWWANHTGLPDSWRTRIEMELSNRGLHTDIMSLRYRPLRGIEASQVVVYADQHHTRTVARLHALLLDVDRTKLSRGEVEIERIDLSGARISIAADPMDPASESIEIDDAEGRIVLTHGRKFEIQGASGMVGGVRLELDCVLEKYHPKPPPTPEEIEYSRVQRRKVVTTIIDTLEQWAPAGTTPPRLRIRANGDLEDPANLRASIDVNGTNLISRSLEIPKLEIRAELRGPALVVHQAEILTGEGGLAGRMEFDLWKQRGRFDLNSKMDLAALLDDLDLPKPDRVPSFGKPPLIEARGTFAHGEDGWTSQIIGRTELKQPSFKQLSADHLSTAFSWDGEKLFLEDILIRQGDHQLTGRAFMTANEILYQAKTDLPVEFWKKSVTIQPLGKLLQDFSGGPESTVSAEFEGMANPTDRHQWSFSGDVAATGISFRGVPAKRARANLDLSRERLDFNRGEVEFDYRDYPLRKKHDGPLTGMVEVDRIRYDREPSTVTITNLRGEAWPAPIVRTFAPKVADKLEIYGFHSNPGLVASGVVGFRQGLPKQDLTVRFASAKPIDYRFAGKTLALDSPRGTVRVLPSEVRVSDLRLGVFNGLVRGSFSAPTKGPKIIEGEIDWTELSLPLLSKAYELKNRSQGQITGWFDFKLDGEEVTGLGGEGHIALKEAELFEFPVFGPLSPLISAVIGKRKAGFQEASEAFCTFTMNKGVLNTLDFETSTSSIVITGDAMVNLGRKTLRMTLRMNARGLFGVITIPLRPFYGMFQFRGTGPIENPEWKNVMFTKPPEQQEKTLLEPPKARRVIPSGGNSE